jgi:Protein of unknown function with HXXEE motif
VTTAIQSDSRFGWAWLLFAAVLALHIADEAVHGFLSVYNPNARAIRARFPLITLPTFTMQSFLIVLGLAIVLLVCLAPLAFRGVATLRRIAVPLSIVAGFANGLLHLASSVYYSRWMPGSFSSPLLLLSGIFLLYSALHPSPAPNVQAAGL